MMRITVTAFILMAITFNMATSTSLMDHLNYYANQMYYNTQMIQSPFSMDNVMSTSMELAMQSCQDSFKWERWNCPSTNFILRHNTKSLHMDKEDAYVDAITTATILYTITKNCSSGVVTDCGCNNNNNNNYQAMSSQCSDNPNEAIELYKKSINEEFTNDFPSMIRKHNYLAVTTLIRSSLIQQCGCATMGPNGCIEEMCINVLKPFAEIAQAIRDMYDESLQLIDVGPNSQVIWTNIPLDALVFVRDSPNFCEPDAVPHWNGMRGRQCVKNNRSPTNNGDADDEQQRNSCRHLCRACGYQVRSRNLISERHCNCKLTWNYQVQCDTCVKIEREHYCY